MSSPIQVPSGTSTAPRPGNSNLDPLAARDGYDIAGATPASHGAASIGSSGGNSSESVRTPPGYLSDRRIAHKLVLSPDERALFSAAIEHSRRDFKSDAAFLPKSTNMGLGRNGPPAFATGRGQPYPAAPPPMQPVADHERAMVLTEHERAMRAYKADAHSWEESETDASARNGDSVRRGAESLSRTNNASSGGGAATLSRAVFLRAIPCMYTLNVSMATSFYRDILGFSLLGKPDISHASLVRSTTVVPKSGGRGSSYLKEAPPDSVQIYLRTVPAGPDGVRERPPSVTLWIQVSDVDAVHDEVQAKLARFAPRADEYFPLHSWGDARVLAKPQNKAWGNREMHLVDGDDNKIIFFKQLN